ncbi:MAG: sigma-54-dependent Fis family transcriptional regulator [Sedimentisphaerales bacterium]|nr:sigma-54-dependent Fis family transcriptional regulator [Sedimentisphaerales bacterium]
MSLLRRIVVVSSNPQLRDIAQEVAHEVFAADDLAEAIDIAHTVTPEITLFDNHFTPGDLREFLARTDNEGSRPRGAVVVAAARAPFAFEEYKRAGASHHLPGEDDRARLHEIAAEVDADQPETLTATAHADYFVDEIAAAVAMVGRSKAARRTIEMIKLVGQSRCNPVLIVGETGTGKEVAARAIHAIRHPDKPFVAVNCAALTANLLESELFGHVKGAFTGADRDKTGLLEFAGEGTLFLDEISEMALEPQAKLLRVLQEKSFRKVGGIRDCTCRATIITSSNRDLKREMQEKRFRQDLYYRLNICPIPLAPLRSPGRREDITLLAEYILKTSTICSPNQEKKAITRLALEALHKHHWPGNVRELRNVIERAVLLEATDKIGLDSIVIEPADTESAGGALFRQGIKDFSLQKAERELIARALHETGWQKTQAASLLGITRATLYAKVKQYNIQKSLPRRSEIQFVSNPSEQGQPVEVA